MEGRLWATVGLTCHYMRRVSECPPGGLMKDGFTVLRKVFDATECSLDLEMVISTTIVALPSVAAISSWGCYNRKPRGLIFVCVGVFSSLFNPSMVRSEFSQLVGKVVILRLKWQLADISGPLGDLAVDKIWDFAVGRCPALDPKDESWQWILVELKHWNSTIFEMRFNGILFQALYIHVLSLGVATFILNRRLHHWNSHISFDWMDPLVAPLYQNHWFTLSLSRLISSNLSRASPNC